MRTLEFLAILVQLKLPNVLLYGNLKSNGNQDSLCIKLFQLGNMSDIRLHTRTLLQVSFIHMFIIFIS